MSIQSFMEINSDTLLRVRPAPATSFEASAIQVVQKDLMDMLVRELKDELEARDQPKTGNKAWLRRRLHGAIVRGARILQSETESHRECTYLMHTFTVL